MKNCLLFEAKAFLKLMEYARGVKTEICGIGRLEKDQFDIPRITDIAILPQIAGGADANVTAADMEVFFQSVPENEREEWCFNWHTHPNFATSPSGTDNTNYNNMSQMFDLFVPMILNHAGEYTGFVYHSYPIKMFGPIKKIFIYELREHVSKFSSVIDQKGQIPFIETLLAMTNTQLSAEEKASIFDEITQKVSQRSVTNYGQYDYGYGRNYNYDAYGYNKPYEKWNKKNNKKQLDRHPHVKDDVFQKDVVEHSAWNQNEKIIVPPSYQPYKKNEKKVINQKKFVQEQIDEIRASGWTEQQLEDDMLILGYSYDQDWQCFILNNPQKLPHAPETLSITQAIQILKLPKGEIEELGISNVPAVIKEAVKSELDEIIERMEEVDYEYNESDSMFYGENGLKFTIEEAKEFLNSLRVC